MPTNFKPKMDLKRKELELFWNRYYEETYEKVANGKNHMVNYDLNLIKGISNDLRNLPYIGRPANEATNFMNFSLERRFFDLNKFNQINILTEYYSQNILNDIFKIMKKLLNSKHYILTNEENEFIKTNVNNQNIFLNIYAYIINKPLIEIYQIWNNNYETYLVRNNDLMGIEQKFNEILNKYNIQLNNGCKPHFGMARPSMELENEKFFNKNNHHFLLIGWFTSDNFECVKELYNYLIEYLNIIEDNEKSKELSKRISKMKIAAKNESEPNDVSEAQKVKKTKKKTAVKEEEQSNIQNESQQTVQNDTTESNETPTKKKTTRAKKEKDKIPKPLRAKVWAQYIGEKIGSARCFCCELTEITMMNFHCGHVIAEHNGGEVNLDNLRPVCQSCNSSMGTMNMFEFIEKYGFHTKK